MKGLLQAMLLETIEPVRLAEDAVPSTSTAHFGAWWWLAGVLLAAVAIGLTARSPLAARWRGGEERRAFAALARRMGLGFRRARSVRRLAEAVNMPAVALLVSEHAFGTALERGRRLVGPGAHLATDETALDDLRRRLFGEA